MAAEAEAQEPKKKLPIVKILIMTVGALVLVGVGAGAAILFTKLTKPADENPLAIVIERKGAPPAADDHGAPSEAPKDAHGAAPAAGGQEGVLALQRLSKNAKKARRTRPQTGRNGTRESARDGNRVPQCAGQGEGVGAPRTFPPAPASADK